MRGWVTVPSWPMTTTHLALPALHLPWSWSGPYCGGTFTHVRHEPAHGLFLEPPGLNDLCEKREDDLDFELDKVTEVGVGEDDVGRRESEWGEEGHEGEEEWERQENGRRKRKGWVVCVHIPHLWVTPDGVAMDITIVSPTHTRSGGSS